MQRNREGRWDKRFKRLLHFFRSGLIQRRKVRARNLRIGDDDHLGDVVHVGVSLHFYDADYFFAALRRQRNCHSPGQLLEVFPIIYLGLINYESSAVLVTFARPAWIARLIGSRCGLGGGFFNRWCKKRCDNKYTMEQRSVTGFHIVGGSA